MSLTKQQCLLLIIVVICLIGYLFLRRTNSGHQPLKHSANVDKFKNVSMKKKTEDAVTGPSLKMDDKDFFLNGKPLRILSGAIHYFRVVPEYWRDRLLKLKAMGLNTVES